MQCCLNLEGKILSHIRPSRGPLVHPWLTACSARSSLGRPLAGRASALLCCIPTWPCRSPSFQLPSLQDTQGRCCPLTTLPGRPSAAPHFSLCTRPRPDHAAPAGCPVCRPSALPGTLSSHLTARLLPLPALCGRMCHLRPAGQHGPASAAGADTLSVPPLRLPRHSALQSPNPAHTRQRTQATPTLKAPLRKPTPRPVPRRG